jgi:hypothetical protein
MVGRLIKLTSGDSFLDRVQDQLLAVVNPALEQVEKAAQTVDQLIQVVNKLAKTTGRINADGTVNSQSGQRVATCTRNGTGDYTVRLVDYTGVPRGFFTEALPGSSGLTAQILSSGAGFLRVRFVYASSSTPYDCPFDFVLF